MIAIQITTGVVYMNSYQYTIYLKTLNEVL